MTNNVIIIDIICDQFKDDPKFLNYDKSVFVGKKDDLHRLFEIRNRDIQENRGLDNLGSMCQPRLKELYRKGKWQNIFVKYLLIGGAF